MMTPAELADYLKQTILDLFGGGSTPPPVSGGNPMIVDVTTFPGVVADGVNDDTAGINAGIDFVHAHGGSLGFPGEKDGHPLRYKVTSTIDLTHRGYIHLIGGHQGSLNLVSGAMPPITIIDGSSIGTGAPVFKVTDSTYAIHMENIQIIAAGHAIEMWDGADYRFTNCSFASSSTAMADACAVQIVNTFWVWFEHCSFVAAGTTVPSVRMQGIAGGANVHATYLVHFAKSTFVFGGVTVEQNHDDVNGPYPGQFVFDYCQSESFNAQALLTFTQNASVTHGWSVEGVSMLNPRTYDSTGTCPLIRITGANCTLFAPMIMNGSTPGGYAIVMDAGYCWQAFVWGQGQGRAGIYDTDLSPVLTGGHASGLFGVHAAMDVRGDKGQGSQPPLLISDVGTAGYSAGVRGDGFIMWSNPASNPIGVGPWDTYLYRNGVGQLKTDTQFQAVQGIATKTKAGTPTDADFTTVPPVGTMVVDTAANKLWVRTAAATWKSVTVA